MTEKVTKNLTPQEIFERTDEQEDMTGFEYYISELNEQENEDD